MSWRRNQAAVTAAAFIGFTGFTLVMPFLPLYFEQLGVTDTSRVAIWSGVSLGVTPAVTAAVTPLWARLAGRFGRKIMVVRSLASFVVIMSLMAFVQHPWQVFALRAIQGLFAGYGALALMMAAESAPPEHTATAIGWVQTAQRLGPALGPILGGSFAQAVGLRSAFFVSAAFYFVAFLLVVIAYRETTPASRAGAAPASRVTFAMLRAWPHVTLFIGSVFALQLIDRSIGPILPLYLREVGIETSRVPFLAGALFTMAAAAAALGNQACGWLLLRWPVRALVPYTASVAAAGALIFALGAPVGVLFATAFVFGFGMGVATTAIYTAATHAVPVAARGETFGYLTTAYLIGLAVSPVVAGLIGSVSMRAVFLVDAAGLGGLAWLIQRRMR
jgi:DHA1 family multidrug resistance protein-like MFS transporter